MSNLIGGLLLKALIRKYTCFSESGYKKILVHGHFIWCAADPEQMGEVSCVCTKARTFAKRLLPSCSVFSHLT